MSFSRIALMSLAAVAFSMGCSNAEQGADDGTNEGAATIENVGGINLNFVSIQDSKPAKNPVADLDMKTCDTNVEYVSISGTPVDAKVNAILKSGNEASATCDDPESLDSSATVKFIGKKFLSVSEMGSGYAAGAAHPWIGVTYKNIDLTNGELITLDKLLTQTANDTILRSVRAQIGVQKSIDVGADGKRTITKLDADSKQTLLSAAESALKQPLAKITGFAVTGGGIRIDLTNELPHAMQGLDCDYLVKWSSLDKAGVILPSMKQRVLAK